MDHYLRSWVLPWLIKLHSISHSIVFQRRPSGQNDSFRFREWAELTAVNEREMGFLQPSYMSWTFFDGKTESDWLGKCLHFSHFIWILDAEHRCWEGFSVHKCWSKRTLQNRFFDSIKIMLIGFFWKCWELLCVRMQMQIKNHDNRFFFFVWRLHSAQFLRWLGPPNLIEQMVWFNGDHLNLVLLDI